MKRFTTQAMTALTLIRIGQELGADSPAARAIHDVLELLASLLGLLTR